MPAQPTPSPAVDPSPDEALVERVVAGETPLFELLMRRNNARLYRAIRSILRDEDAVEELMQQTYVLAFSRLGQFGGGARFSTWLLRIGINEALQRLRRARRWPQVGVEALEEEPSMEAEDPGPETLLARSELLRMVEGLVDQLPTLYRTVFVLREVQQLSTAEVADLLELSPEAVKQRLSRARSALRTALEQRTGEALSTLFPFEAPRCDRVVAGALADLGIRN
jgi:RNA polymerase sigma-70 factor (ECF subfamily)